MKTEKDRKIEKLEEAIRIYSYMDFGCLCDICAGHRKTLRGLAEELTALDKEIEQGGQRKNAEEILNKYPSFCYEPKLKSVLVYIKADIIRAMEEYAQQKCYPEEFVKWVVDDIGWDAYFVDRYECLSTGKGNLKFDELLPYWLTNIKDK